MDIVTYNYSKGDSNCSAGSAKVKEESSFTSSGCSNMAHSRWLAGVTCTRRSGSSTLTNHRRLPPITPLSAPGAPPIGWTKTPGNEIGDAECLVAYKDRVGGRRRCKRPEAHHNNAADLSLMWPMINGPPLCLANEVVAVFAGPS